LKRKMEKNKEKGDCFAISEKRIEIQNATLTQE
jgi:hypothetical protein